MIKPARSLPILLVPLAALLLPAEGSARPQESIPAPAGSLEGRVVDADDGRPLGGAEVLLVHLRDGAMAVEGEGTVDASLRGPAVRRTRTDDDGRYRFRDVLPGAHLLSVRLPGYRGRTVRVRPAVGDRTQVSVGLRVQPIALEPIVVRGRGSVDVTSLTGEARAAGRIPAVRLRQAKDLSSDARLVGEDDIREAATLGEPDILRAIQRLPGVATRNDYTAELWTRGASWGETRVLLDGIPLFNPLHGFGVLSGMSHRGLGAALFHPGVRPVDSPESGAARLELRSRSGRAANEVTGGLDLSLASAQGWGRGPLQGGRGGWMVTVRRSYADVVAERVGDDPEGRFPYVFTDVSARFDAELGPTTLLTVSGLWESDDMKDELPDLIHGTRASWGNATGQATLTFPVGDLVVSQSAGGTVYTARVDTFATRQTLSAPAGEAADHRVAFARLRGEVSRGPEGSWRAGYDLVRQSARYAGPEPWPYSRRSPDLPLDSIDDRLLRVGVWAERRLTLRRALEVQVGLRVEGGGRTASGSVEVQPRVTGRLRLSPGVTLSLGTGRYVQYAQSPAPVGPLLERALETGRLWLLAGPRRAPLDTRIVTLGGEAWLNEAWLASATAYARDSRGVLLPDPTPGFLIQRSPLVEGRVSARGVDLSLRRLAGRVTGSVAYSLAHAEADAAGITFPAPADRRHVLDVTGRLRLGSDWNLGLAYTFATGSPYARTLERSVGESEREAAFLVDPFRRRTPSYASLDLVLDYAHDLGAWSVGGFLQARNLTGHDNDVTYTHTSEVCPGAFRMDGTCVEDTPVPTDRFTPGIPTIPLLGLRLSYRGG